MGNLIKYTSILVVMSIIMGGCASNTTNKQRSKKNTEFVLSNLKYEKKEDGKTIEYEHGDISYDFKNKIIYAPRFNDYACIDTQLPAYYGLHEPRTNDAPRLDFNYLTKKSTKFMKNFDYIINYSGLYKLNKNNEEINFTRYFLSKESNSQVFKFNKKGLLVNTKQDRYGDYKWNTTFSYKNNLLAEVNYTKSDDKDMYTIKYKYNDNNQIISYDEFLNKSKKRSAIYTYENSVLKQIEGNDFDNKDYKIILEYDNNGCLKKEKIIEDTYTYYYEYSYDTITNLKNKQEDLSYEVERYHLDEKDEKEKEIEKNSDESNDVNETSYYPTISRTELEKNSNKYIGRKISFEGFYIAEGANKILLSSTYRKTRLLNLNSVRTKELNEAVLGTYDANSHAKKDYNTIFKSGDNGDISSYYRTYVKIKGVYKGFKSDKQELHSGMVYFDNAGQSIPIIEVESIESYN